ncbi:MAG TPA: OsmC family protein [Candidatus Dormibacteraeota bacterium]
MKTATARWSGEKVKFDIESGSGHSVAIDEPPIFGDDLAMRPTEMLLGALGGCTGLNAVLLLKKYKQPVKSLEVEVEGEQDEE